MMPLIYEPVVYHKAGFPEASIKTPVGPSFENDSNLYRTYSRAPRP